MDSNFGPRNAIRVSPDAMCIRPNAMRASVRTQETPIRLASATPAKLLLASATPAQDSYQGIASAMPSVVPIENGLSHCFCLGCDSLCDPKLFLDLLQRNALRFRDHGFHPDQLQHHHACKERKDVSRRKRADHLGEE